MTEKKLSNSDSAPKSYPEVESPSTGKVAEAAVATYTVRPAAPYTRTPSRTIAGIAASDEVWRFAVKNELIPHLETAVQVIRESFQKISDIRFAHEIDPEIENESWITIRAKVAGSLEELLREDWAYTQKIVRVIPINKLPFIRFIPVVD